MTEITQEEWENLYENFETADLLLAVDAVDSLRDDLNDGENFWPPELRTDLLKLHELACAVVNYGVRRKAGAMFDMVTLPQHSGPPITGIFGMMKP